MNEAIQTYTLKTHYYVEYLHWNNKGFLDGFVDHQNNMYLLNDDYDERKLTQGPKLTFSCERQVATEIRFSVARWKILVAKKCP